MAAHTSSRGLAVSRSLAFQPVSVVWRHLSYYVTVPKGLAGPAAANIMCEDCSDAALVGKKRLLNDLTGFARPGVLTALMGGSGAGASAALTRYLAEVGVAKFCASSIDQLQPSRARRR